MNSSAEVNNSLWTVIDLLIMSCGLSLIVQMFHYCPVFIPPYVYVCVCAFGWLFACVCVCVCPVYVCVCIDTVATAKPSRTPTRRRCITRTVTVCSSHSSIITNNRLDGVPSKRCRFHPCVIKFILRANNFHQARSDYRRPPPPARCLFSPSVCLLLSSSPPSARRWQGLRCDVALILRYVTKC